MSEAHPEDFGARSSKVKLPCPSSLDYVHNPRCELGDERVREDWFGWLGSSSDLLDPVAPFQSYKILFGFDRDVGHIINVQLEDESNILSYLKTL